MSSLTPFGVTDLVPDEADEYNNLLKSAAKTFDQFGFNKIRTPTIEYFDTLAPGLAPGLSESAIKFFDAQGKVLMLRPDHTTPIARLVATRMKNSPKPLKLYYLNSVFRSNQSGQEVETFQAGVETFGDASAAADAEVIKVCIQTLKNLGYNEVIVDIGHTDFKSNLNEEKKQALLKGDYVSLGHIPPRGQGELVADHKHLSEVWNLLVDDGLEAHISINMGLAKGLSYYTGIIFDCAVKGVRQVVASGGRYDNLTSNFGYDCPAIGFALNISAIFKPGGA